MKSITCLFLLLIPMSLSAATDSSEISELRTQLLDLLSRVEALESENRALRAREPESTPATAKPARSSWTDTISMKGDLRYRYESFDIEDRDDRERQRVRARLSVTAKPTDNLEIGVGLASGGDDPVSTNQTLGSGASTKDIRLDLAYFKWAVSPDLTLRGGKFKNIWQRPGGIGLLWDGDLRSEGLALSWQRNDFFVDTGINFLESDSRGNEQIAYGLQTGYSGDSLTAGIGYFYMGTSGRETFYGDPDDFFGNSYSCTAGVCTYNHDFEELELFAEWKTTLADRPFTLFADYVQNQDADDLDTGWMAGFKYGKASGRGTWELGYSYQDLEADAVLGLWSDSDFGGGGTDVSGHILKAGWALSKKWKLGVTYFDNTRGMDLGGDEDYRRLQLDTAFKF